MTTKIAIKIAMPRMPIKEDSVLEMIREDDLEGFIQWVKSTDSDLSAYEDIQNNAATGEFEDFFSRHGEDLAKIFPGGEHNLPHALAPSELSGYNLKSPSSYALNIEVEEIVDDYFGICYIPKRVAERYLDPNIKAKMAEVIKAKLPDLSIPPIFMGNASVADLVAIYGRQAVKNWWRSLEEGEVLEIQETCPSLYETCTEIFGGGLEG
jgi:hypothetical protein